MCFFLCDVNKKLYALPISHIGLQQCAHTRHTSIFYTILCVCSSALKGVIGRCLRQPTHTHTCMTCQFSSPLRLAATDRNLMLFPSVCESRPTSLCVCMPTLTTHSEHVCLYVFHFRACSLMHTYRSTCIPNI